MYTPAAQASMNDELLSCCGADKQQKLQVIVSNTESTRPLKALKPIGHQERKSCSSRPVAGQHWSSARDRLGSLARLVLHLQARHN